jgi:hypothetical protein
MCTRTFELGASPTDRPKWILSDRLHSRGTKMRQELALVDNMPIVPAPERLSRLANRDNEGGTKGPTFYPGPLTS